MLLLVGVISTDAGECLMMGCLYAFLVELNERNFFFIIFFFFSFFLSFFFRSQLTSHRNTKWIKKNVEIVIETWCKY